MSQRLISLSPDLARLQNAGYDIEVVSGYLLMRDVPYVTASREVKRGTLVTQLTLAGDVTIKPGTHVVSFTGEYPCFANGTRIAQIEHSSAVRQLPGIVVQHMFSSKPGPNGYADYYAQMTAYETIISAQAQRLDPNATARTFPVIQPEEETSVFQYLDTASTRAEIGLVTQKLEQNKVVVIGLGGTGSYVLDLIAKTPVKNIHLYDGDRFLQHNAFRSPGAPSLDELKQQPYKTDYWQSVYSKMHRGIVSHPSYVNEANLSELQDADFVFICIDASDSKRAIVENLERHAVSFIDVGMGLYLNEETASLGGMVTTTTSTPAYREHLRKRVSFGSGGGNNEYDRNIQIADLNALNASLAVIRWKKLCGFYQDQGREHFCCYMIGSNKTLNEDKAENKTEGIVVLRI